MPEPEHRQWPNAESGDAGLEREATEWFFRRDEGLTATEARLFRQWLRDDERHAHAFAEIEATWNVLGTLRHQVVPSVPPGPLTAADPRWCSWRTVMLGAACLVLGFSGWLLAGRLTSGASPSGAVFAERAVAPVGGWRKSDLPDGSILTLNSDSAVDVRFTATERRVRLVRGETHFVVAKDPRRPFVVEANGVAVRAVGTTFNIRLHAANVEVIVTEGLVRVDDAAHGGSLLVASTSPAPIPPGALQAERMLQPGERVVIPSSGGMPPAPAVVAVVSPREIAQALAWQERWLEYSDAPLSAIVADFNRHNQHQLVVADARLAHERFGGTFPAGDYRSLVQVLEKTFGVAVERRERETLLRLP